MVKHRKTGAYEHFCVLIFAQGTWKEVDKESIRNLIKEKSKTMKDIEYNIFDKLVFREQIPIYSDCHFCQPIYKLFEEIKGNNDGILYQGHHYLIPEDDFNDLKSLANLILSHSKVKKFYLLYLDGLGEIKRTALDTMTLEGLKEIVHFEKCNIDDFLFIVDNNKFKNRTIYEVSRSKGVYN
jgi:hypothetical protein